MTIEKIKLTFAHKNALQTFTAGLNAMFLISFDNIDYIAYYNFRRFYTQAIIKLQNEMFSVRKNKTITLSVELNIFNSLYQLIRSNEAYLKADENSYLKIISLEIMEQGRRSIEEKQTLYNPETFGL